MPIQRRVVNRESQYRNCGYFEYTVTIITTWIVFGPNGYVRPIWIHLFGTPYGYCCHNICGDDCSHCWRKIKIENKKRWSYKK
jgi:hypothetical protein